jgi:hypothetical protein
MPYFSITYAYDVPFYADMKIEAATAEEALAKARALLDEGAFNSVVGKECFDNLHDDRVFDSGDGKPLSEVLAADTPTAAELIAEHRNPTTVPTSFR